jgi:hypothetical protein
MFEDRQVVVEILALERVGDHRLVLDAHLIGEAASRQCLNRAFELPWRGVGSRNRKLPRDVVLQDRRRAARQRARHAAEINDAIDIGQNCFWGDTKDRDRGFHAHFEFLIPNS